MNKFRSSLPLVTAALLVGLTAAANAQKPKNADSTAGSKSNQVAIVNGDGQVITTHYVRAHHSAMLLALAKQVQEGTASQDDLERYAGPSFAAALLKTDFRKPVPPTTRPPLKTLHYSDVLTLLGQTTILGTNDYVPSKIEYDDMIPGEVEMRSVNITSPIAGTVAAHVSKLPADFNIMLMESYTGYAKSGPDGASQIVDKTSTTGSMDILSGQQFSVAMQIGSVAEGTYQAVLSVNCSGPSGSWNVEVPMKIKVSKKNDYRAEYEGYNPQIVTFPGHDFVIKLPVKPINYRGPFSATLSCLCTPGLSAENVTIKFTSNKTVTAVMHCKCLPGAKYDPQASMAGAIVADNKEATFFWPMIEITPYQVQWKINELNSWYNNPGIPSFGAPSHFNYTWLHGGVIMDGEGHFAIAGEEHDNDTNYNYQLAEEVKQGERVDLGIYFTDFQGLNHGSYNQITGTSKWIKSNWDLIFNGRLPLRAWYSPGTLMKYFDSELPPLVGGMFAMPFEKPIVILKW